MRIALVRHPKPAIAPGICYGRLDLAVADDDVAALAGQIAALGLAEIWTSPAQRCRRVAEAAGLPWRADARLLELDFGAWEGVAWNAVPRAGLDRWAADPLGFAAPDGESGAALLARVQHLHADLRALGRDCAVVSHGGPLRLLAAMLRGEPADLLAVPPAIGSITLVMV